MIGLGSGEEVCELADELEPSVAQGELRFWEIAGPNARRGVQIGRAASIEALPAVGKHR